MGTIARWTRAHSLARAGCPFAGERPAHWPVSPPGAATEPGQAGGYRASAANRADAHRVARNPILRIQYDRAVLERTAGAGADRVDRERGRSCLGAKGHEAAGKLCGY